jgi:hypothetical protein
MVCKSLISYNLARTRGFESLGCSAVGFYFWHILISILNKLGGCVSIDQANSFPPFAPPDVPYTRFSRTEDIFLV